MKGRFLKMKRIICAVPVSLLSCTRPAAVPITAGDYLSLGEKYLPDLDYEHALVQNDRNTEYILLPVKRDIVTNTKIPTCGFVTVVL